MVRDLVTNFATTALQTPNPLTTTGTSFTVTTNQGALFPSSNFCVDIDTEIILISARSGDTFTVASNGRGFSGTTAASHTGGGTATVQLSLCAYNLDHLWQNVADTYHPEVPPTQALFSSNGVPNGVAGPYDNEFETLGSWVVSPDPTANNSTLAAGTPLWSHLLFLRAGGDNTTYTAYSTTSLTSTSTFSFTCKVSQGTSHTGTAGDQAQFQFFVSDQANPSASFDSGNRFRLFVLDDPQGIRQITMATTNGAGSNINLYTGIYPPLSIPLWLRITYDGSGNYRAYWSNDGIIYWAFPTYSGRSGAPATWTPLTVGVAFKTFRPSNNFLGQQTAVDYIRSSLSVLPNYGN